MKTQRPFFAIVTLCLLVCSGAFAAEPTKIGVVDIGRVISDSPQAKRAKTSMANQFAQRKKKIEARTNALRGDVERLKRDGAAMSDAEREKLQINVRDRQRELQLRQSQYNDDVADAEQSEFERMRKDIRAVIDQYAKDNHYDIILGDSVLYASDAVDVTDEILGSLRKR